MNGDSLDLFFKLIVQIIPLLCLIGVGFYAGRKLDMNMHSMGMLSIYILSPFVVCVSLMQVDLKPSYIAVPIFLFFVTTALSFLAKKFGQKCLDKPYQPLMPLLGGTANTGYFGIPIVTALLGPAAIGIYMLFNMALLITEVTSSYYLSARGHMSVKDSLKRVLKLPPLYGVIIGVFLNILPVPLPTIVHIYWTHATGAYIIIGMMLIGVGLSKLPSLHINLKFTGLIFLHKFIIWPAVFIALIYIDKNYTYWLNSDAYLMLFLISICPLPANAVAYAVQLKLPAEETAAAILASTLLALIYVPAALTLYFLYF
jgi:predicted permease